MSILNIFGSLIEPISGIVEELVEDKDLKNKLNFRLRNAINEADKEQNKVNAIEANHQSVFVAGWRPAVAWICVVAMFFNYIAAPLIIWGTTLYGAPVFLPTLDFSEISPILFGMLGLGGLRTIEKMNGLGKSIGK